MKRQKRKLSFRESISRAFLAYALAPVTFLAVAGILAVIGMMTAYVIKSNEEYNDKIAVLWEEMQETCFRQLETFCEDEHVIECTARSSADVRQSQQLYDFQSMSPIPCRFFWLDSDGKVLAANTSTLPGYLTGGYVSPVSIRKKIQNSPGENCLSIEYMSKSKDQVLCMGRAIQRGDQLYGFLIFEITEDDFRSAFQESNGIHYIIANPYRQVLWYSGDVFITSYGKVLPELAGQSGMVAWMDTWVYTQATEICSGFLTVYTVTDASLYIRIVEAVMATFVSVFLLLMVFIYITAGIIGARQSRSVDRIVEAMENISYENLEVPLTLRSGDELENIAASYNKMTQDMKQLIARNEEMARQNVISEIKQLELQLEPHFLYNTLELIRFMTKIDPDHVGRVISALGALLRQSINLSQSMLTVKEEIEYCKNYLLIQKYRFGEKMQYQIFVEDSVEMCPIPKQIIQPLVENALKHGTDENGCCRILLRVEAEDGQILIRVEDEGKGLSPDQREELMCVLSKEYNDSHHNGLYNIHRRVVLTYGERYGVSIENRERGAVFCIRLPFEKERKDA